MKAKELLRLLYLQILVIADTRIDLSVKLISAGKLLMVFAPLAYILKTIKWWFISNEAFVAGFLVILTLNAAFGMWRHWRMKKFNWIKFFWENNNDACCSDWRVCHAFNRGWNCRGWR